MTQKKFTKILILALVAMVVFSTVPAVMAGNGNDQGGNGNGQGGNGQGGNQGGNSQGGNNNDQGNGNGSGAGNNTTEGLIDPVILYIGWTYDYNGSTYTSMGNGSSYYNDPTLWVQDTTYDNVYRTANDIIYAPMEYQHIYVDIIYDPDNTTPPTLSSIQNATSMVEAGGYAYLFVDMFFLDISDVDDTLLDAYNDFVAAATAAANTSVNTASMYSDPADTPSNFEFNNVPDTTAPGFEGDFSYAFEESDADIEPGQPFTVYLDLLSYL